MAIFVERKILYYQTDAGKVPVRDWLFFGKLDKEARNIILERLHRVSLGNPGHWRSLGKGVYELKIDYGPGYRVYYGNVGKEIVLLLCGGSKRSQNQDIKTALEYWADFKKRNR